MRIGIITFHHAHNCGAMLQVLALQSYLQNAGHEIHIINYRVARIDKSYTSESTLRKYNFDQFMKENLHLSPVFKSLSELQHAQHPYDAIIAGSDQIWNEAILGGLDSAYFCNFGSSHIRRIIYGASLGTEQLSRNSLFLLPRFLQYPDYISVREASAIPLIQSLTEKAVAQVLDPTLLSNPELFRRLATATEHREDYIYLHYVHISGENPHLDHAAESLSLATGLPICKNRYGKRFSHELKDCSDDGPKEFLSRILNARYIVSDSFHANVFSILFHKHFLTVLPIKRSERLIALLESLSLSSHLYRDNFSTAEFLSLPDYSSSLSELLIPLRRQSEDYLHHALYAEPTHPVISYFTKKNPFLCYGCSACHKLYPEAISGMQPDEEGFLYPCTKNKSRAEHAFCIYHTHGSEPASDNTLLRSSFSDLLAYHNSLYERMISYEGGLLPEFFRHILSQNGSVIGRSFDVTEKKERYCLAQTEAECLPFLAVRPQEAPADELLHLAESHKSHTPLLILACACHLAALRKTLISDCDNVILIEQYCSGMYSSVPILSQMDYLQQLTGQEICDYNFASKHYTPSGMRVEYIKTDGSLYTEYRSQSRLLKAYYDHTLQRPSCYACTFRAHYPSIGDLAIAAVNGSVAGQDSDDKIISYLQILSDKGNSLLEQCKQHFTLLPSDETTLSRVFPDSKRTQFPLTARRPSNYITPSKVVTAGPVI